jgi:hypothetical protein
MKFYPYIYLDRLRRTTENLSQGHQHLHQSIYTRLKTIIKNKNKKINKARVLQAQKILVDVP